MKKPIIVFVINSIGYGGAERALANILGRHAREGWEAHLVTLDDDADARAMPAWLTRHRLDARGGFLRSVWQLARLLRRLKPDLCVSLLVRANLCTVLTGRFAAGGRVIICERMHLTSHLEGRYRGWRLAAAKLLPRLIYRHADAALGVSSGVSADLVARHGVPPVKSATIFNPYDLERIRQDGAAPASIALPASFAVAVGRLTAAKNMALLIEAFLDADLPHALIILGDGEERGALEALIRSRGAEGRVLLPGYLDNPFSVMSRARFYVSASRNEGFPNAMVEAMALGAPVVASDCPSGPAEILAEVEAIATTGMVAGRFGLLVPVDDRESLTAAMIRMDEPATRDHYAAQARLRAADFGLEAVASLYWSFFRSVLADAGGRASTTSRNSAR